MYSIEFLLMLFHLLQQWILSEGLNISPKTVLDFFMRSPSVETISKHEFVHVRYTSPPAAPTWRLEAMLYTCSLSVCMQLHCQPSS